MPTPASPTLVLLGTLDTKEEEYRWVGDRVSERGVRPMFVDVGTFSDSALADVPSRRVAEAAGHDLEDLRSAADRGAAMQAMAAGAAAVVRDLYDEGRIDGVLAVAGSGGSSVAAHAMQALPVGVPKLLVSTMASGDVGPYVGEVDVTIMYSVVDVAGINSISEQTLGNAAGAAVGMVQAFAARRAAGPGPGHRPLVALTMFGLTTKACDEARARLTELGYEVLVFHATGAGGRAMESLAASRLLAGVLDLTTTELADELVGGVLTAGPHRLEAAGAAGIPQVVSVGALDMVNFGSRESVPDRFQDRRLVVHNPTVTLMRTTAEELASLAATLTAKLTAARGPVEVHLPLGGLSGIDVPGGVFEDPAADAALVAGLRDGLAGTGIPLVESPSAINDPGFGRAAAEALHRLITTDH
jgi:uncharacterized protein (UPF0261 family)